MTDEHAPVALHDCRGHLDATVHDHLVLLAAHVEQFLVSSHGSPVILPTTTIDSMMRCHDEQVNICVPITPSGDVAPRWGRADRVAVAEVGDGIIRDWREFEVGWSTEHDASTEGAHHARIATFLLDNKITAVAVQHVGPGMQRMLDTMNVTVFADRSGSARDAVIAGT